MDTSSQRVYNARRLTDGGMGERLGYKSFEETTFGEDEDALEGEGWAAVNHAVSVHSHEDSPELRQMVRQGIKDLEGAAVA